MGGAVRLCGGGRGRVLGLQQAVLARWAPVRAPVISRTAGGAGCVWLFGSVRRWRPSARRLKDATRSVRLASGERIAGCGRATRVRAAAGTEAGLGAGLGAGAWLCTCGCAVVRLCSCVHVGWHKGGGGGDKRTSSRVKMSFVTTAMECESRRAEQSCSVSAVLPDPTGPPMPTLRAKISLTKAGCCSALRCTHGREAGSAVLMQIAGQLDGQPQHALRRPARAVGMARQERGVRRLAGRVMGAAAGAD